MADWPLIEIDPRPLCELDDSLLDADGCYPISVLVMLGDCRLDLSDHLCFSSPATDPPEPIKERPMATTSTVPAEIVYTNSDAPLIATVAVPESAIEEIKALIPADGNITGSTVALAVVGLAGSGAVLKLAKSVFDAKQQQAMKKLEIEEQKSESDESEDDEHQACGVARLALEAKIDAVAEKLDALVEKLDGSLESVQTADEAITELREKLAHLESLTAKPAKAAAKKPVAKKPVVAKGVKKVK